MENTPHYLKVIELSKAGVTISDIANYLQIPEEELVRDYSKCFYKAIVDRNVEVAETVYRMALEGNLTACQFWLKNLGKWDDYAKSAPKITDDKIYDRININVLTKEDVTDNGANSTTESD